MKRKASILSLDSHAKRTNVLPKCRQQPLLHVTQHRTPLRLCSLVSIRDFSFKWLDLARLALHYLLDSATPVSLATWFLFLVGLRSSLVPLWHHLDERKNELYGVGVLLESLPRH